MSALKVGDTVLWVDDKYEEHRSTVVSVDPFHDCFLVDHPDPDNYMPTTALTSADIVEEDA